MREHLYKAKRVNWRELPKGEWWVEGNYVFSSTKAYIILDVETDCIDGENTDLYAIEWYEVIKETVCEYTGLPDKNGIKIFEGSIVRRTDLHTTEEPSVGFIEYDTENTAFLIHWTDVQNYSAVFPWKDRIEVIGNIFDNPDLLNFMR